MSLSSLYASPPAFGQGAYATTNVAPTPSTADYSAQLQTAYRPQFDANEHALQEKLAAQGILHSGAGTQQQQYQTGLDNATIAQSLLPILQQSYAQQNANAQQDASASNASGAAGYAGALQTYLQALQQQQQGSEFDASLGQARDQFGQTLTNRQNEFNAGAQNQLQLAQLGYGNQDYLAQLGQIAGLYSGGATSQQNIYANGVGQISNAGTQAAGQAAGFAQGLGSLYGSQGVGGLGFIGQRQNTGGFSAASAGQPDFANAGGGSYA